MKKLKYLIVVGVIALLYITNPTQSDFSSWCKQEIKNEIGSNPISLVANSLSESIVDNATTRNDYFVFSTYEIANKKFLGVGKYFINLN